MSRPNALCSPHITNVAANADEYASVQPFEADRIDYVIDFVGGVTMPQGSTETLLQMNMEPAMAMAQIAEEYHVKAQG